MKLPTTARAAVFAVTGRRINGNDGRDTMPTRGACLDNSGRSLIWWHLPSPRHRAQLGSFLCRCCR